MSGSVWDDIHKLELAIDGMRSSRSATLSMGDSPGAEVGNNLAEALGRDDGRFEDIYDSLQAADRALELYGQHMNIAIEKAERIRAALMRLGNA